MKSQSDTVRYALLGAWSAAMAVTVTLAGCAPGHEDESTTVRDSAGVSIVESFRPLWEGNQGWRLGDRPILEIGTADGSPEYQFHQVEGVLRTLDGRIAVADGGAGEIRFYDSTGSYLGASGGRGDAPGEYRSISALGSGPGDSLWVYDYGNRRFTVLSSDGEPVRTVPVGGQLSAVGAVGRLPDGSFVIKEGWGSPTSGSQRTGLTRDPVVVAVFTPNGLAVDTLGVFPGREVFVSLDGGRAVMSAPLFAHNTSASTMGHEVLVGIQETMEIGVYSVRGELKKIIRAQADDLRLDGDDIERRKLEVLDLVPESRRAEFRRGLDQMDVPDTKPAYGRIAVGEDGSIWLAEPTRYPEIPRSWTVFGPDGRLFGRVTMPEDFRVFRIDSDWIMGVGRDELDVEYVRVYRLVK